MLGGAGTCRLGYSAAQHTARLSRLGYVCRVHTFDLVHMRRDFLRLTREFTDGRPLRSLGTGVKR